MLPLSVDMYFLILVLGFKLVTYLPSGSGGKATVRIEFRLLYCYCNLRDI
jgi:hypothetical protein